MPNFDAGQEDLTYDFTKYVPDAKGVIPEPSSNQIAVFLETLRQVMPVTEGSDGSVVLDVAALADRFKDSDGDEVEMILAAAVSEVCSGTPTAEQVLALPYRVKARFYGWVIGTFLSPEA